MAAQVETEVQVVRVTKPGEAALAVVGEMAEMAITVAKVAVEETVAAEQPVVTAEMGVMALSAESAGTAATAVMVMMTQVSPVAATMAVTVGMAEKVV